MIRAGKTGARAIFPLSLVLLCSGAIAPLHAQKITKQEAMMAKVLLKYRAFKTLSQTIKGKMNINLGGAVVSADFSTSILLAQPDRMKVEATVSFFGQEKKGIAVTDGKTIWDYDPEAGQYSEQPIAGIIGKNKEKDADWLMDRAGLDFGAMFFLESAGSAFPSMKGAMDSGIQIKDYPTRQVDGRAMYVLPVPMPGNSKNTASLYVDAETMLLRRARIAVKPATGKGGKKEPEVEIVIFYNDIKTNVEAPETTFTFTPPESAKKADKVEPVFPRAFDTK